MCVWGGGGKEDEIENEKSVNTLRYGLLSLLTPFSPSYFFKSVIHFFLPIASQKLASRYIGIQEWCHLANERKTIKGKMEGCAKELFGTWSEKNLSRSNEVHWPLPMKRIFFPMKWYIFDLILSFVLMKFKSIKFSEIQTIKVLFKLTNRFFFLFLNNEILIRCLD